VPAGAPLIIGGDFNDWRNQLSHRLCEALGVIEAFDASRDRALASRRVRSARTYPALVPWLRMDRIYLRGFKVEDARVPRGAAWARLSDHSPVIADLRLRAGVRVEQAARADA
jgi:endonuclease/exonuclease/phosphatase family metal-dependent hydrolase